MWRSTTRCSRLTGASRGGPTTVTTFVLQLPVASSVHLASTPSNTHSCAHLSLLLQLYSSYYGGPSTIDDIVNREAARAVRELLKLRRDPYMFVSALSEC